MSEYIKMKIEERQKVINAHKETLGILDIIGIIVIFIGAMPTVSPIASFNT